ncbi:MAG: GIY-YIG nuclease family protein [Betaproteobacteria bacterium]|nr:GIY-YIG nuclease family protein [Betaproteobacteria bacterium]
MKSESKLAIENMPTTLSLEHLLEPFGFDSTRRTKLVRHQEQGVDLAALHRAGQFEFYQSFQGRAVFENCEQIVSFIGSAGTQAVFVGVYQVLGVSGPKALTLPPDFQYPQLNLSSVYVYQLNRDKRFDVLIDRLIIDWGSGTRSWVQKFRHGAKEVVEVLPRGYVKEFSGFLDFVLRFDELKAMIDNPTANREWHRMLGSVSGVYLILDSVTGRQYIGSAYGDGGIIARWSQYARTGHGGNAKLKALLTERPNARSDLHFSVLQTLSPSLTAREVIAYEVRHKEKLGTRAHGLNSN